MIKVQILDCVTRFFDRTYVYKDRIKKLKQIIEKKNSRIQCLKDKYQKLKLQDEVLKKNVAELKLQIEQTNNEIKDLQDEIIHLSEKNKEISILVEDRSGLVTECANDFEDGIHEYRELFIKMSTSELLRKLMQGFGICFGTNRKDYIFDMISFIRMIGNGVTFADILYSYLEENCVELGENEQLFITELNQFYRKVYGLHYDVVLLPNPKLDNKFDKNTMKDNINRNGVFKYYSAVYVPAVFRNQNNIEKRAIVSAHN